MHLPFLIPALSLLTTALSAPSPVHPRATNGWTIQDFSRNCTDTKTCIYAFTIDVFGLYQQNCTITDVAEPATTHSWYNVPCQENPAYRISWGWGPTYDFTVMTVVFVLGPSVAWFGYDHPNAGLPVAKYPDVGPYAVQRAGVNPGEFGG